MPDQPPDNKIETPVGDPPKEPAKEPAKDPAPEGLGDAGKKALDAERAARREAEQKAAGFEAQVAAIGKALGLSGEADPEKLSGELETVKSENRRLKTEAKVSAAAAAAGADPEMTWAYLYAQGIIDSLDPAAADFDSKVAEAVKAAVTAKPVLTGTGVPRRDGGPRGLPVGGGKGDMNEWIRHQAGHT